MIMHVCVRVYDDSRDATAKKAIHMYLTLYRSIRTSISILWCNIFLYYLKEIIELLKVISVL